MANTQDSGAVPMLELNDGASIPQMGFGVFQVPAEETTRIVTEALRVGYRHIDTAWGYMNEAGVGEAIRQSDLDRDDVFVTTKIWNSYQGRDKARKAFDESMANLGLDRLDLLLIHWPAPENDLYVETWETFVELRDSGRVTSIGVSNFVPEHLERIIDATGVVPVLNQVELHPYFQQPELRQFHAEHGIATEAWSPIARGRVTDDEVLTEIGEAHGKTAVQMTLRWELQRGIVVIPKSEHHERIAANFDIFDIELSEEELARIDALDRGDRAGPDPRTFS